MPRLHLASSLVLGSLLAANTQGPAFSQESAPPGSTPPTLPPVKVSPAPERSAPAQRPARKKRLVRTAVAPSPPQRPIASREPPLQPETAVGPEWGVAAGAGLGSGEPSGNDLSPAASAQPAASTTLNARQIERLPIISYGDIFRSLPGIDVSNYGQGAIGYGISIRGFTDAEHGRDIAYFIDGVPLNEISSIHTPNYADLNVLIPETVRTIEIIRGPFAIEAGDSNVGGSIFITTKSYDPYAEAKVYGGSWGTGRGLATYGADNGSYVPYLAVEGYTTDGYRDNSTLDRYNTFDKITVPVPGGAFTVRVQAYGTTSGAPGYLNRDALLAGLVSATDAVNPTDGADKTMQNIVAQYASGPVDQQLAGMVYTVHDIFTRWADFCPVTGCQRVQNEERESLGGRVRKIWTTDVLGVPAQILAGGSWRTDIIDDFQAPTVYRQISGLPTINAATVETNLAGYAQLQVKPLAWLKLTCGSRIDQFFYNIDNRLNPAIEPDIAPTIASPKAGASITPLPWLELYTNYGQGFRSPDSVLELIPNYPQTVQPFKIESEEVGVKVQSGPIKLAADVYRTDADNEAFQPAPGLPVTLIGQTRREGYELEGRYDVWRDGPSVFAVFANYAAVDAFRLEAAGGFVPNVPTYTSNLGVTFNVARDRGEVIYGEAYINFTGKKFLTEDGGQIASAYQKAAAKVAYAWPSGWTAFTQATWYPGNLYSEAAFDFGDPVHAPSTEIFVGPVPEFTILAGFSYRAPSVKLAESFKE